MLGVDSSDADLKPKFDLVELDGVSKQHSCRHDIPIPGNVALKIISGETLAHSSVGMARVTSCVNDFRTMYDRAETTRQLQHESSKKLHDDVQRLEGQAKGLNLELASALQKSGEIAAQTETN